MKHCPNTECPDGDAGGRPAEYRDDIATCAVCGTVLVRGERSRKTTANRPLARLAVSVAAALVVLLAGWITLPGLAIPAFHGVPVDTRSASVVALGLSPLLSAFLLVELVALAAPALRRRRLGGPSGRPLLRRMSFVLAIILAGVQASGVATLLGSTQAVANPGWSFHLLTILTLTAATSALFALTEGIDRWGLGNGFSVLILASTLPDLWRAGLDLWRSVDTRVLPPGSALLALLVLGSIVAATRMILEPRQRWGRDQLLAQDKLEPFALRLPACGAEPIGMAASILMFPATIGVFLPAFERLADDLMHSALGSAMLDATLGTAAALSFAWLFNNPARVMAVWRRVQGASPSVDLAVAKLRAATLKSVIFVVVVIVGSALVAASVHGVDLPSGLLLVIDTAILLDLVREWHARSSRPDLVPVWPVHRVYAVDAARHMLERAGIETFPRGAYHRTMLQFFGPYVAIDLLVPADRAEQARDILERLLLPD